MIVGIPKEIKDKEGRVGMAPMFVSELVQDGHEVVVQTQAGHGIGKTDAAYEAAGAKILPSMAAVYEKADMIIKVKEPLAEEFPLLREDQILFTFLHLAAEADVTRALVKSKCRAVAYETITDNDGRLPLLAPSSKVAGRLASYKAIQYLQSIEGGKGLLMSGVPGVRAARILILGGGYSGRHAAEVALGAGADVTLLDISNACMEDLNNQFGPRLRTLYSAKSTIEEEIAKADAVIAAVLVVADKAPKLVTKAHLDLMEKKSVLVDISIDQGGCFETSRPTSHTNPIYEENGILHYCVTNMPGAVPMTSTYALNNAVFPFARSIAKYGLDEAMEKDIHLERGLNVDRGKLIHPVIQKIFGQGTENYQG